MFDAILLSIIFVIGLVIGVHFGSNDILIDYCSQYEMEYSSSLECCVNKDKNEIKNIKWRK